MKKRQTKRLLAFMLCMSFCVSAFAACGGTEDKTELTYPDRGYANADSDSWLQIEEGDDMDLQIDWYVNLSYHSNPATLETKVGRRIYEKTGIKINWLTPVLDDGTQLSTMISGNKLPDVVTVGSTAEERWLLPMEGLIYPIDELSKRYAPTLMDRIDDEIETHYEGHDGHMYAVPNHFYTDADLQAFEEQEGSTILSNGAIVAREDWLNEYIAYKKSADKTWTDVQATTPDGFIEMCKWVKENKDIPNSQSTVLLSQFTSTGSNAISWILQYFCTPREDKDGNLVNTYRQLEYEEALLFLNRLYREGLISGGNLSATQSSISSQIGNGTPFIVIASPQDFVGGFASAHRNLGVDYVPVLLTNSKGAAPQLASLAGKNGYLCHMITTNCERPDRVAKLFDYLLSEEGQSLYYGILNEDFTWEVEPGGTAEKTVNGVTKTVTYKYGKAKWADTTWENIVKGQTREYGFMYSNPLINPMYPRLTGPNGEVLNTLSDYITYNNKAALNDYVYTQSGFAYSRDITSPEYAEMMEINTNISLMMGMKYAQIVSAKTAAEAKAIIKAMIEEAVAMGADRLLAYDNVQFKKYKEKTGIAFAWPPNDPQSGYDQLRVTTIFGNRSNEKEIPAELDK